MSTALPKSWLAYLRKNFPAFKAELPEMQFKLAEMIWVGSSKHRRHKHFEGAMTFGWDELQDSFGRTNRGGGFEVVNDRVNFFTRTPNWSEKLSHTRGYWFTEQVTHARERFMAQRIKTVYAMVNEDGSQQRTLPRTISARDKNSQQTSWRLDELPNKVAVDLDSMKALTSYLTHLINEWESGKAPHDLVTIAPDPDVLRRIRIANDQMIRLAHTEVAGRSYIAHRYCEVISGRLYAEGINLQTAPRIVKQAALPSCWEYDMENCHFTILSQMAAQYGYQCSAVADYLNNKKSTRESIALRVGVTPTNVKKCLLMLIYGATPSTYWSAAIPDEVGSVKASLLYEDPVFKSLMDDIKNATDIILKQHGRNRKGNLVNTKGRSLVGTHTPAQELAHLMQGVEALALEAAVKPNMEHIVLLQHDGFASVKRLDKEQMERDILAATGYKITLESEQIRVDIDEYFSEYTGS
jgi:hypothetical protein